MKLTEKTAMDSHVFEPKAYSHNQLGVDYDEAALLLFLKRAKRRSHETFRRYTRELIRFTIFISKALYKEYRNITLLDVEKYVHFIQNPWTEWQKPGINKDKPEKVYFPYAIKPGSSTDQVITVLSSFFHYLQITGYNYGNPFAAFDKSGEKFAKGHGSPRFFFQDEWTFLLSTLQNYPENSKRMRHEKARLLYIFSLAYGTGLRESELSNHTCQDIKLDQDNHFILHIKGKGRRIRQLPVTPDMMKAINIYRHFNQLNDISSDLFPLAPTLYPVKKAPDHSIYFTSMKARQIRHWFLQFMQHCAKAAYLLNKPDLAERLLQKSFHSLRHTALSHLANKMKIEDLSIFAGHESIITTQQYYTPEKDKLKKLTQDHHLYPD